jgi:K+/H+ antiporter YhaU regulatory subunit KhtT
MTITRVGSIEEKVNQQANEISRNERNIAVLLEKVSTIEQLVREIRQEMTKLVLGRAERERDSPGEKRGHGSGLP